MDMLELIRSLPQQIDEALKYKLPDFKKPEKIFICGMGGSAISGDLAKIIAKNSPILIETVRDYTLPAYAKEGDLLIASSYSGNTEETISAFIDGISRNMQILAISSSGKLLEIAKEKNIPYVKIPMGYPPRTALGYLLTPIVNLFYKLGLIDEFTVNSYQRLPEFLTKLQSEFESEDSDAVKLAAKYYMRIPVIYSSTRLHPVALRWKAQINENSKAFCHTMEFPEMNHNEINGIKNPKTRCENLWITFLKDPDDHPRIILRFEITRDLIESSIQGYSFVEGKGENFIERIFYLVYLGDYVSYFLAKYYNEDPIDIPKISELKRRLGQ
ncbi:MAG: bifunctional phosphoglucose/phosphomannose isomerase [Candidatus Hydrothermia bacterium]